MNVKKTELIIFHPKSNRLDYGVKFKFSGRRLTPVSTVKNLGIFLDEHLLYTKQVNCVNSKRNQAIAILIKLRYNTSSPILKIVYHSLFGSHLQYGTQLWGQGNCINQYNIQNLQNRALKKIPWFPLNTLYKDLKILTFIDLLHLQNCLFVLQIEQNQTLEKPFLTLKHCGDNHNYQTWASTKRILDTPVYKTNTYGKHSVKYHCILDWNQFKRIFSNIRTQSGLINFYSIRTLIFNKTYYWLI